MLTVDVHNHFIPTDVVGGARKGSAFDGLTVEMVDRHEWLVHRQGNRYPLHRASMANDMAAGPLADQLRGVGLDDESVETSSGRNMKRRFKVGALDASGRRLLVRSAAQ